MHYHLAEITNNAINPAIGSSVAAGRTALQTFLSNFIALAIGVGVAVFLIMLIWGGISFITAGGDKEAVARATKRITNALVGVILLLSVYVIIKLVGYVFGINVLNFSVPVIQ